MTGSKETLQRKVRFLENELLGTPEWITLSSRLNGASMNYLATHPMQYTKVLSGGSVLNPKHDQVKNDLRVAKMQLEQAERAEQEHA